MAKHNPDLIPQKIQDKNGRWTTVYVKPDQHDTAAETTTSDLDQRKLKRHDDKVALKAKDVLSVDEEHAEEVINDINDDPYLLHEDHVRADVARIFMNARAREDALEDRRQELKRELINSLTDGEISEGIVLVNDDNTVEVEVRKERDQFYPERANLHLFDKIECSTSVVDSKEAARRFPDVAAESMVGDGTFEISATHDADSLILKRQCAAEYEQKFGGDDRDAVSRYLAVEEEQDRYVDQRQRLESAIYHAATDFGNKPFLDYENKPYSDVNQQLRNQIDPDLRCPSTGASVSVTAGMKCDASQLAGKLRERRRANYEKNGHYYFSEKRDWNSLDEKTQNRILDADRKLDMMKLVHLRIDPEKVKQKFPDKYKLGSPETRQMYITDVEE